MKAIEKRVIDKLCQVPAREWKMYSKQIDKEYEDSNFYYLLFLQENTLYVYKYVKIPHLQYCKAWTFNTPELRAKYQEIKKYYSK